jgi:hypothetical protein
MGSPTGSAPRMGKFLSYIIRNLRMPGASLNIKQRLSSFGKTSGGAEGLTKKCADKPFIIKSKEKR